MSRHLILCTLTFLCSPACGGVTEMLGDGESAAPFGGRSGIGTSGSSSEGGAPSDSLPQSNGGLPIGSGGSQAAAYDAAQLDRDATLACGSSPWIFSGLVRNSRDLGGVPLAAGSVTCKRVYRGSQLNTLGETGCAAFAELGIKTVIDLRTVSEASMAPPPVCVRQQAKVVAAPMATPYNLSPTDYLADLHESASIRAAFEALSDPAAYPLYFHCIYGRDRTGVFAALMLDLLGASRDVIMAEYLRTVATGMGGAPESLSAVLDELAKVGGAEAYLSSIGVSAGSIAQLREMAKAPPAVP